MKLILQVKLKRHIGNNRLILYLMYIFDYKLMLSIQPAVVLQYLDIKQHQNGQCQSLWFLLPALNIHTEYYIGPRTRDFDHDCVKLVHIYSSQTAE